MCAARKMMLAHFVQNILDSAIVIVVSDDAAKPVFCFSDNVDITPALRSYQKVKIRQPMSISKKRHRSRRKANADLLLLSDSISIAQELGVIDASSSIMQSMEKEASKPKHESLTNDYSPRRPTRRESMSLNETLQSESVKSTAVDDELHREKKTTHTTTAYVMPLKSEFKPNSPIAGVA